MNEFNSSLKEYCENRLNEFELIKERRKESLAEIADYIKGKLEIKEEGKLIFICTHNSRRSHLAHFWAHTAGEYFRIRGLRCFSGGTEESAFNLRAVAALIRAGALVENMGKAGDKNPSYKVYTGADADPLRMFSKVYDHLLNPHEDFAAVMVCSDADENCPFVPGADKRFRITYEDPKEFDDTDKEKEMYDNRCRQIAREMFYVFQYVKKV